MDAHQSLTTKRYIFCQQCLAFPNSNREFYFTQCKKIFCRNCLEKDPKYHKCSSECRMIRICNDMREDVKFLFQDPGTSIKRNIKTYEFIFKQYEDLTTISLNLAKQQSDKIKELYNLNASKDVEIENLKKLFKAEIEKLKAVAMNIPREPLQFNEVQATRNIENEFFRQFNEGAKSSSNFQIRENLDVPPGPPQLNEPGTSNQIPTRNNQDEHLHEFLRPYVRQTSQASYLSQSSRNGRVSAPSTLSQRRMNER
ncbi:hypothetical protein RDWZM_009803 [Blomia tropicalis]|uniref:RING-type domain-containing protein n=1 Tax=Blomia tropicalis TaxID=40697 RepID=A0A9Q0RLE9_BLOTA|nr:hypothetical protein RDWZM_009803 [Blomia tropicalis]